MCTLTHHARFRLHSSKLFQTIQSYSDLNSRIREYGMLYGHIGSNEYNSAVGEAFEVYCEYFFKRYDNDVHIGVKDIHDTSDNKFQDGYDFTYISTRNDIIPIDGRIQCKWRGRPDDKFTRNDLGTFCSVLREENIDPQNSILFTNLFHNIADNESVFHFSWDEGARRQMRVFGQYAQQQFIFRDSNFWSEFNKSLVVSSTTSFVTPPPNRPHQDEMEQNQRDILINGGRATQICATGGGKTKVEHRTLEYVLFDLNKQLTILVAPTIDLAKQHFNELYSIGFYHKGVHAINFHTGSEPDYDDHIQFVQTTNTSIVENIFDDLIVDADKKVHIITTYKSLASLVETIQDMGVGAHCTIFDEYQHLISQQTNDLGVPRMREFLMDLPSYSTLFFSASIKRGRVLSALDEQVFGPIVTNIPYNYLRERAILVPKLVIKVIRIDQHNHRIAGLSRDIQVHAKAYANVDIVAATIEAAGVVVATEDAKRLYGQANLVTFSERVDHCKIIGQSEVVQQRLSNVDLHVVHSKVSSTQRKKIYDEIRNSEDNVLLQHSCVTEGIDVTSFNCGVAIRSLGIIEMQQGIGRIVRAHPEDTKRFQTGELKLDDPTGWKKYSATFYVLAEANTEDAFVECIKDLSRKLQGTGLTIDDYQMAELVGSRHGVEQPEDDWKTEISAEVQIGQLSLEDVIRRAQIELEEEERRAELNEKLLDTKSRDIDDLLEMEF